ncbi:putative phage tail protein, partial [uncultured Novosphingobium sp.]|uniref:putative phage tail protein n=1 Tax=uncultured Novosphingobium sp. TaxID=292277 RepID=UPI00259206CA
TTCQISFTACFFRGVHRRSFFVNYAAAIGFEISITSISPFRVESSTVETPLYDEDWLFVWVVTVLSNISGANPDVLVCEFEALKPAHTYVLFQ